MSRAELAKWVADWKVILSAAGVCIMVGAYGQTLRADVAEAKEKAGKVDRIEKMIQRVGDKLGVSFEDIH